MVDGQKAILFRNETMTVRWFMRTYGQELWPVIEYEYHGEEAKGTITIEPTVYGPSFNLDELHGSIGMIDLYHRVHPDGDDHYPQIVIDNGNGGDSVAFAKFTPEGARVSFETGVHRLDKPNNWFVGTHYDPVFGYLPDDGEE